MNLGLCSAILLADELRHKYSSNGEVDLESLAQENGITIFEDERIRIPRALYEWGPEGSRRSIGISPLLQKKIYDFFLAHEIGHHLLGHHGDRKLEIRKTLAQEEKEANTFASYLTGKEAPRFLEYLLGIFKEMFYSPSIILSGLYGTIRFGSAGEYFDLKSDERLKELMVAKRD